MPDIVVDRALFAVHLARVMPAVGKSAQNVLLHGVLVVFRGGELSLHAQNGEQHARSTCDAPHDGNLMVLVQAVKLHEIVRSSRETDLRLEHDGDVLRVHLGSSQFELLTLDLTSYQPFPAAVTTQTMIVEGADFARMLRQSSAAVSGEAARYAMQGVCIAVTGPDADVQFVGTNGRCLVVASCKTFGNTPWKQVVVPPLSLRLVPQTEGRVTLSTNGRQLVVKTANLEAASLLVEGTYPQYSLIIPKGSAAACYTLVPKELTAAVRQAGVMADRETLRMRVDAREDRLEFSAQSADSGKSRVELLTRRRGLATDVFLNPVLLSEILGIIIGDECELGIRSGGEPITVTTPGMLALVMPMT